MNPDRLCLALDVDTVDAAQMWTRRFATRIGVFKIGLQLFVAQGPAVVSAVRAAGATRIFLDLKLHDIPNTVAGAVRSAAAVGVDLLTVHCAGGFAMLQAAQAEAPPGLELLGVTALTSLSAHELAQTGVTTAVSELVQRRAALAFSAGLAGVVCSALEVTSLRAQFPTARLVTPGIRLPGRDAGDQLRIASPRSAFEAGASIIVLGRAIRSAPDPDAALAQIEADIAQIGDPS